jgi:glycine/D-amino acid oxidase-like deaminating enzyme
VQLKDSEEAQALRYLFFASKKASKPMVLANHLPPVSVQTAAVVGAGFMGCGIAICLANARIPVLLLDVNESGLDAARERIGSIYASMLKNGRLSDQEVQARTALIQFTSSFEALSEADLVVEAVYEDMQAKLNVFSHLEADYATALEGAGLPKGLAAALASYDVSASQGALYGTERTLSELIGRPTTTLAVSVERALRAG